MSRLHSICTGTEDAFYLEVEENQMTKSQQKNAWIDFDETFEMWGVYDIDSGFCYNMFYTQGEAEEYLKRF